MAKAGRYQAGLGQRLQRGALAVAFAGITVTGALVGAAGALALPTGFTDTLLPGSAANPLSAPTAIVPLLDTGRALVLEKAGAVRLLQANGSLLATLRVEWVALAFGSVHTAGSWETTWAGWEATPNAIAANPNARYL